MNKALGKQNDKTEKNKTIQDKSIIGKHASLQFGFNFPPLHLVHSLLYL